LYFLGLFSLVPFPTRPGVSLTSGMIEAQNAGLRFAYFDGVWVG